MEIKGCTEFYDGWLSRVLLMQRQEMKSFDWKRGYDMADETDAPIEVMQEEIKRGHILVSE